MDILPYGVGIATGTVGPCDMSAFQVFNVKVIISDSSGSDKRNFIPFKKVSSQRVRVLIIRASASCISSGLMAIPGL